MSQARNTRSSSQLESNRGQAKSNDEKESDRSVTSTITETEQETTSSMIRSNSNPQPQSSGQAAVGGPSHIVVAEEITVGVPLFRPKKEFLKILKCGGADCDYLTKKEMCHYLKEYVFRKRLYNPHDPREVNCGEDELGGVFGVQRFTISEVLQLINRNCNQLPDSRLKKTHILVARPLGRNQQETGAAPSTQTQIAQVTGDRFSPVVCIDLTPQTSIITSSVSSSGGASASLQSTSSQGTPRESGGGRRQRRRSKRRQRPKHKKAARNNSDQNQPSTSSDSVPVFNSQGGSSNKLEDGSPSKVEDSSDDLSSWLVGGERQQESDTFSIEYELEDSEPTEVLSESSSVVSGQSVIVVCSDSDVEFWADESDTEWNEADHWACECGTKNKPLQRHCIFCWKIRPGWLGEKRKCSPSSEETDSIKKFKEESIDSGVCLSSQDTASSQTMELNALETRRTFLNYRGQSPVKDNGSQSPSVQKGPEDPCVICLKRSKTGSIIHGSTGHQVCCYPCAKRLKRRKGKCPVCRRKIKDVIRNYVL
ncbi:E3 ubiquitin-protein ligase Mdm2-like isoform X2 [Crassostrea virginica]